MCAVPRRVIPAVIAVALVALGGCRGEANQAASKAADTRDTRRDDEQVRFDRERQPQVIVTALGLKPGMVVADIGAGSGLLTVHVAAAVSPGGKVVATDIDAAVLDYLKARMITGGYEHVVEGRVVDPAVPGLEDGRYDAILLAQVDHYFEDRVAWLRQARPALAPDGKLAIANRLHHRAPALAAAEEAGFHLVTEISDIPGQFVAVFEPAP